MRLLAMSNKGSHFSLASSYEMSPNFIDAIIALACPNASFDVIYANSNRSKNRMQGVNTIGGLYIQNNK